MGFMMFFLRIFLFLYKYASQTFAEAFSCFLFKKANKQKKQTTFVLSSKTQMDKGANG